METVDLCPQEDLYPVPFATRKNPAFPTRSGPQDYLDLKSIKELVDQTLEYLGKPVPVRVKWSRATAKHGSARQDFDLPERGLIATRAAALNAEVRARRMTTAAARKQLNAYAATLPRVYTIVLAKPVFQHATVQSRADTIIHEACHIAAPFKAGHGPEWQALMLRCGVKPEQYAAAPEGIALRWVCSKCGRVGSMTPKMAALIQTGTKFMCNTCATPLSPGDMRIPPELERRVVMARRKIEAKTRPDRFGILPGPPQKACLICGRSAAPGRRTCGSNECNSKLLAFYMQEQQARCPQCNSPVRPGHKLCAVCEQTAVARREGGYVHEDPVCVVCGRVTGTDQETCGSTGCLQEYAKWK